LIQGFENQISVLAGYLLAFSYVQRSFVFNISNLAVSSKQNMIWLWTWFQLTAYVYFYCFVHPAIEAQQSCKSARSFSKKKKTSSCFWILWPYCFEWTGQTHSWV